MAVEVQHKVTIRKNGCYNKFVHFLPPPSILVINMLYGLAGPFARQITV